MKQISYLLTPDVSGRLELPPDGDCILPVAAYLEQSIEDVRVRFAPNIWENFERANILAGEVARIVWAMAGDESRLLTGTEDRTLFPLFVSATQHVVSMTLVNAMRLHDTGYDQSAMSLWPARRDILLEPVLTIEDLKKLHKPMWFQWSLLRSLAGAQDSVQTKSLKFRSRVQNRLRSIRKRCAQNRRQSERGGIYGTHLHDYGRYLSELDIQINQAPDLICDGAWARNYGKRSALAGIFTKHVMPAATKLGVTEQGVTNIAQLFSGLFPESRLEGLSRNMRRYEHYFAKSDAKAFMTSTGQAWSDVGAFSMSACSRQHIPTIVLQHGGQYGYDNKMPHFFLQDFGLPDYFVSWGWDSYPGPYDKSMQRAEILPMPSPRLSRFLNIPWTPSPTQTKTLFVPLSKARTLDQRFGGIVTDGHIAQLRRITCDLIAALRDDFDRIVVSYREESFETDPLRALLPELDHRNIEIVSSRKMPASQMMQNASAVFWDVATTGVFESLNYGIPTVTLLRHGRWASESRWAEDLLEQNGIGAYNANDAATSLKLFSTDLSAWQTAREAIEPVVANFGLSSRDCGAKWRDFVTAIEAGEGVRS